MKPVSFYLVTDTHYLNNVLEPGGEAFEKNMVTEQFFVKESGAIISSTFDKIIEDKEIVKSKDFQPTIVLLSDGCPTDYEGKEYDSLENYLNWEPIKLFHEAPRCAKCMRIAMSVDEATDLNMLRAFLNNETEPMQATNANDIAKMFKWVTMSTINRMSSTDPDNVQSFLKFDSDAEDDDILV